MLGNLLGGTIGKFILGGVGIVAVAGVIYILVLQGQLKDKDALNARQQVMIQAQAQKIEALDLQWRLQEAANAVLDERLKARDLELEALNSDIESILTQGAENDGPVAPILDGVVRAPTPARN